MIVVDIISLIFLTLGNYLNYIDRSLTNTYLPEFEKEFNIQIPDDQAENIATVGQAISYIENI